MPPTLNVSDFNKPVRSKKDLMRSGTAIRMQPRRDAGQPTQTLELGILDDEEARKTLLMNYVPWSQQAKKRSITQTRYGSKRPATAYRSNKDPI